MPRLIVEIQLLSVVLEVPTLACCTRRLPSSSRGRLTILLILTNIRLYTNDQTVIETNEALMVFLQMVRRSFRSKVIDARTLTCLQLKESTYVHFV